MEQKIVLQLRRLLKELEEYRARHTELISVYIPSGYSIVSVTQQLMQEQGTAENIKSKNTRKNVQTALEKMIRQLRNYKATPPNGLAAFSGNVSEDEGMADFKTYAIEPPEPVNIKVYKCAQEFYLDPLKDILSPKKTYGLLVIDRQEANLALLKGTRIVPIYDKDSLVPGKTRKGGQSAHRFERVREGMAKDFFKLIADTARKEFEKIKDLAGIIVGGPGPTKEDFVANYLPPAVKEKVLAIKNIGYTGDQGMQELVAKSDDLLAKEAIASEKAAVNRFLDMLNKRPSHVAYGKEEVQKALDFAAVELLLISERIPEKDAEELANKAESIGGNWILISKDIREEEQLWALGGVAAILRFSIS